MDRVELHDVEYGDCTVLSWAKPADFNGGLRLRQPLRPPR